MMSAFALNQKALQDIMNETSNMCSPAELLLKIGQPSISVVDASYASVMGATKEAVDIRVQYQRAHLPGAVFFDIDGICDKRCDLPHMLPSSEVFSAAVGEIGIGNDHEVVVYDSAGLYSAARVWWMFKVFGHKMVRILDGGLPAWLEAGGELESTESQITPINYRATFDNALVADKQSLMENCQHGKSLVLDARSEGRFFGNEPEPRAGLPSGHMPYAKSLPFDRLIDKGRLRSMNELKKTFEALEVNESSNVITSCGSGITAAIITLALSEAGYGMQRLYDGSWSEWASAIDTVILNTNVTPT